MSGKIVILVTGATGQVGTEVCTELSRHPEVEVRAGVHTPGKDGHLPDAVQSVPLDLLDPASVATALEGVDRLFMLTPGGPLGVPATRVLVDAIKKSGNIQRIVKMSSIDPDVEPQAPTDLWALESEAMVRETGLPFTFLRPTFLFQNFSRGYWVPMMMMRTLALPFGEGKAGWLDSRDVAAVGVKALLEDGHEGQAYTLTGPRTLTLGDIAAEFSRVTGVNLPYIPLSDEQWFDAIRSVGGTDEQAAATLALIAKTRDGFADKLTPELERLLGHAPRTLEQFAEDHRDALTALVNQGPPAGPPPQST